MATTNTTVCACNHPGCAACRDRKSRERSADLESQVRTAIIEGYLETGDLMDAAAIASRLGWSETKLRRAMNDMAGCPRGIMAQQDVRPSREKNYGTLSGAHRVWVYAPATYTLREMILAMRGAK